MPCLPLFCLIYGHSGLHSVYFFVKYVGQLLLDELFNRILTVQVGDSVAEKQGNGLCDPFLECCNDSFWFSKRLRVVHLSCAT